MKPNKEIKKSVKTFVDKFNKDSSVTISDSELLKIIESLGEMNNANQIAENCEKYISDTIALITKKMGKIVKAGGTSFGTLPEKTEELISNTLHDIVYSSTTIEGRDVVVNYMPSNNQGELFAEYANNILNEDGFLLSEAAIMDVKNRVKRGESETTALVELTTTLSTLTKEVKEHYIDKKESDFEPSNENFNEFIKKISVSYDAVHELYNQKSFFGKWLTFSGWMLRGAMNSAKDCVKAYYDDLAKKNVEEGAFPDIEDNAIIPGVDGSSTAKISKYLNEFSDSSRIQIVVYEDGDVVIDASQTDFHDDLDKGFVPKEEEPNLENK